MRDYYYWEENLGHVELTSAPLCGNLVGVEERMEQLKHEFVAKQEQLDDQITFSELQVGEWFRFARAESTRRDILRKTARGFVSVTGEPGGCFADAQQFHLPESPVVRVELVEPLKVREVWL